MEAAAAAAMKNEAESGGAARGDRKMKKTLGRQRIEIKPIKSTEARHVCFSKRRGGLFKKITELSVLCGAHVAAVVFSPGGRPFSYGHPSVGAVFDRFLDPDASSSAAATPPPSARTHPAVLHDFESETECLVHAIEAEALRREALDAAARAAGVWTDDDVRRAGMPELAAMLSSLERVQAEAAERAQEMIAAEEAMMQQSATANNDVGGGFFHYLDAGGTFTAADGRGGVGGHQVGMDTQMMVMGGSVGHAPPFPQMMMPPPPPPPFNHGFDHDLMASYGYDLQDGAGHGAANEMEGLFGTTTCNFFQ